MKQFRVYLVLLLIFAIQVSATPPMPPVGKRWTVKENLCDEFNGTKLDKTKWFDYKPNWRGRPPGLFVPEQVSVGGGYMMIRGEKMKESVYIKSWNGETNVFTIAGGAVSSRNEDAYFGYYECRFKAARTSMSTTFWLSTRQSYDGPKPGDDKYGLELDFQECIGREGDFKGSYFAKGMNCNSHFWYTDTDGEKHDLRAKKIGFESEQLASDDFNTYGGWWRDESTVSFYYNNGDGRTMKFNDSIKAKPFDKPMGLNLVSETYPFPWIELPSDEELADPENSTCYYDWVRVYTLVDVDSPASTSLETVMFDESVKFLKQSAGGDKDGHVKLCVTYRANADRELYLEIRDKAGTQIGQQKYPAIGGYGRKVLELELEQKLKEGDAYTAHIFIRPVGSEGVKDAYGKDEFKAKVR